MNNLVISTYSKYSIIKSYAENELKLQEDPHNDINIRFRQELLNKMANDTAFLYLAEVKKEMGFIKNNIRFYFTQIQNKENVPVALNISGKIDALNERYKELDEIFLNKFKELSGLCSILDVPETNQLHNVIIASILTDKKLDIILDVVNKYIMMIGGKISNADCIKHGIEYTEKDSIYPKGLFKDLIPK